MVFCILFTIIKSFFLLLGLHFYMGMFNLVFLLFPQIELIDRVDDIYRNTTWDDEFKGYGVQIHQVRVCVCVRLILLK